MNKLTRSSPALSGNEKDDSSLDDFKDAFLDIESENKLLSCRDAAAPLNASTPCLSGSRPSSTIDAACEWEEPWRTSMANSDSCLISSSSNPSPLTGTSSQGISPIDAENKVFSFECDTKDQTLSTPSINDALQTERDFMEYVMSFPVTVEPILHKSESKKSPNDSSPKVGLDHLDNLCKLMEQLSDLKETNFKLKRRVQYLEDLKTLHEIHREMIGASTLCNSGVSEDELPGNKKIKSKESPNRGKSEECRRSPPFFEDEDRGEDDDETEFMTGLYRSKTTTEVDSRLEQKRDSGHRSRNGDMKGKEKVRERSKSVGHPGHAKSKKRSSRWSKVKEVLGIEKQESAADGRDHSEHSLDASSEKTNTGNVVRSEMVKYGNVDADKKEGKSAKVHKERPRSGILSSNSFSELQQDLVDAKKDPKPEDTEAEKSFSRMEKYEQGSKRLPKTPWGRMKTMITIRRDCRNQKSESSSSSSRGASEKVISESVDALSNGQQSYRRNARPSRKSSFNLQEVPKKYPCESKGPNAEVVSEHKTASGNPTQLFRQKRLSMELVQKNDHQPSDSQRLKSVKVKANRKFEDDEIAIDDAEGKEKTFIDVNETKTESVSPSKQRISTRDGNRKPDNTMLYEQQKELPATSPSILRRNSAQIADVEKVDDATYPHVADMQHQEHEETHDSESKDRILGHPCATATVTELLKELQQNLSDDFNRKLEEWQKFRNNEIPKPRSTDVERKDSFGRFRKFSKIEKKVSTSDKPFKHGINAPKKDLSWLEKELQKVDREILRLSKEKQKFEKRAFRLQKLKESMADSDKKNEVLVRTPAGEFRFEGISNAFTKKLYEWETKRGVGPELSTIALLDESLNSQDTVLQRNERLSVAEIDKRSITSASNHSEKFCYQKSNSEPDLSTLTSAQKDTNGTLQAIRSKSGDTLLAASDESIVCSSDKINIIEDASIDAQEIHQLKSSELTQNHEDNYYSLLEENMFLLDQLKGKEDICSRLQNELDRLDEKAGKANLNHQEEMEKYRQKLWEIHMSRPRDLQGSLQLISELKTRIDELQKCSDKLKSDREKLEQSFRYHTEQQRQLADDLIHRMVELQNVELPVAFHRTGCRRKWRKSFKCDASSVARIHELSTKLLQQAREMEEALAEKTRQVCHLRWELLHRDMSAVLLQAALHRVTTQGPQASILPAWDMKRIKFKELKAWSIDTTTRRQSEDTTAEDWLQDRLRQLSLAPYNEWTSVEFNPNDLMSTVHELKKETIRMSSCQIDGAPDTEVRKKTASCSAESEMADSDRNYDTGSALNSRSSSLSSGPGGGLRGSHSDTRLYERSRSLSVSARRNSSSSMSCVSGFDASESSSMHDSDRMHFLGGRGGVTSRNRRRRWSSRDNISSSCSSRSSGLEDDVNLGHWHRGDEGAEDSTHFDTLSRQLQLKYGVFKETDEENIETGSKEWGSQCLITPQPIHVGLIREENVTKTGPSNSFLQTVRNSKTMYSASSQDFSPEQEVSSKTELPHSGGYLGKIGRSQTQDFHELKTVRGSSNIDSILFGTDKGTESELALSQNSSAYTSAESLDNFKYVTEREQQLFTDIRNLAIACEIGNSSSKQNEETISDIVDPQTDTTQMGEKVCKSPDITQFKYKGTKGFGRTNRINFRHSARPNTPSAETGIEVASNGSPDSRYGDQAFENCLC